MATFEENLYAHLIGHAGLSALVGARVYPLALEQGSALPAVSYQRVSATYDSMITTSVASTSIRLQVDSWAADYLSARAVAAQVRAALLSFTDGGNAGDRELVGDLDLPEPETKLAHVVTEIMLLTQGDR